MLVLAFPGLVTGLAVACGSHPCSGRHTSLQLMGPADSAMHPHDGIFGKKEGLHVRPATAWMDPGDTVLVKVAIHKGLCTRHYSAGVGSPPPPGRSVEMRGGDSTVVGFLPGGVKVFSPTP